MRIGKILHNALKSLLQRPVTVRYITRSGEMVPIPKRFRGKIAYDRGACVGCLLCIRVCPGGVITATEDRKVAFNISRCIFCGQCVEICPKEAIKLSPQFEVITDERNELFVK